MAPSHKFLLSALKQVLKPLVRMLLRHGVAYNDFADVVRSSYVKVAHEEFPPPGRKQSMSNVAVITGLHRHDVKRILDERNDTPPDSPRHNRAARVIMGWRTDPEFSTNGQPRSLEIKEEFKALVTRYSGDVTPRPILDELLRVGAVSRDEDRLQLLVDAYVPHASDRDMMQIFGASVSDLIDTVDHNLMNDPEHHRLQISVVHDNLPDEVLDKLERTSRDKSMVFLEDMNRHFAKHDRDSNPAVSGSGRNRAGIGLYYFKGSMPAEQDLPDTAGKARKETEKRNANDNQ